jgi:hypothetical protein
MSDPVSTIKVTSVEPCGDGKVCITLEMVVDAHRMVEVSGKMLSVAAKDVSASNKMK